MYKFFAVGVGLFATLFLFFYDNKQILKSDGFGITQYLISLGYSKSISSGIAGNLYAESRFNPLAVGDFGQSFGLAQWHKSRWDALKIWSAKNNKNIADFKTQLDFIDWELKNTEKNAYSKLIKTTTPENSAYVFAKYYERPLVINQLRMSKAREIYNNL